MRKFASLFLMLALVFTGVSIDAVSQPAAAVSSKYKQALKDARKLTVKGRAPKTGYDRALYGPAWTDKVNVKYGYNGCDTRNDILKRDLTKEKFGDSKKCVILTGVLKDKYTGKTIHFKRGVGTSTKVQIDHIVALSDSWQKGAQKWSREKRMKFANDPINLMAADGPTNASKGDKDAATWLPPNKKFRCKYVAKQVAVKKKYKVWATKAERTAMVNILKKC